MATEATPDAVEAIQRDLACPACGYNLRGLTGDVIPCPECGTDVDIARLVTQKWTKPWHKAPGLNRVYLPTLVLMASLFIAPWLPWAVDVHPRFVVVILVWVAAVGLYLFTQYRSYLWFGSRDGPALALLSHLLLAGYLYGILGILAGVLMLIMGLADGAWAVAVWGVILGVTGIPAFLIAHHGEKFVAARCIRRYLQLKHQPRDA